METSKTKQEMLFNQKPQFYIKGKTLIQTKAIFFKNQKLFLREKNLVFSLIVMSIAYPIFLNFIFIPKKNIGQSFRSMTWGSATIFITNLHFTRQIIMTSVHERSKKIRPIFKIMGLSNLSWFLGNYSYIQLEILILNTITIITMQILQYLMSQILLSPIFVIALYLYATSSLFLCSCISLFIKDPSLVEQSASLISGMLAIFGVLFNGIVNEWYLKFLYFIPNVVLISYRNELFYGRSQGYFEICVLLVSCLFYIGMYVYLDLVLPDEYSIKQSPCFCLKKKFFDRKKRKLFDKDVLTTTDCNTENNNKNVLITADDKTEEETEQIIETLRADKFLEAKNLCKDFGNLKALDNVSFKMKQGEIMCVLGHNGAGKSTLINVLCGVYSASSGHVYLKGNELFESSETSQWKIGYCPDFDVLYENFTCKEYQEYLSDIKLIKNKSEQVKKWLTFFGLEIHDKKTIKTLSGGNKKKLQLACSMIEAPDILFLDEPTSGLDPETRRELWNMINELKKSNAAIVMTTNHLEEAEELANDIMILSSGKVKEFGTVQSIKNKYGTGYEIIIDNLRDINKKNDFIADIESEFGNIKINQEDFERHNFLKVIIPNHDHKNMPDILEYLEINKQLFTIKGNTLEDIYIKMEEHSNVEILEEEKLAKLFLESYGSAAWGMKMFAVVYRKLMNDWSAGFQIAIMVFLMCFPAFISIFIVNDLEYFIPVCQHNLPSPTIVTSLILIIFLGTSHAPFNSTTVKERENKMRYILLMSDIDSYTYYIGTWIADGLSGILFIISNMLIAYCYFTYKNYQGIDFMDTLIQIEILCVWINAVIATHYNIGFMFDKSINAIKMIPIIKTLGYISVIVTFYQDSKLLLAIMVLLTPNAQTSIYLISMIYSKSDENRDQPNWGITKMNHFEFTIQLCASWVLLIGMSICMDQRYYRVCKDKSYNVDALERPTLIYDESSLQKEVSRQNGNEGGNDPIAVKDQKKVYKVKNGHDFYALKGSTFSLRPNEILGILGPNGAGKSTTFNILSAFLARSDGNIKIKGQNQDKMLSFYHDTGCCFQEDILWDDLTVNTHSFIFGLIKGVPKHIRSQWLKILNLKNFGKFKAKSLSSGMRRKLCLSMAMASNPRYKFLDEPSTGLDPIARSDLIKILKKQRDINQGSSTIFTTHIMSEAERLCDRIGILVNGGFSCIMDIQELKRKRAGYKLNLFFRKNNIENSKKLVQKGLRDLEMLMFDVIVEYGMELRLRLDGVRRLSEVFEVLDMFVDDRILKDYWCSVASLEDVFFSIAKGQKSFGRGSG